MAVTVFDYIKKVELVKSNLPKKTAEIIDNNKSKILDLNRENQLYEKGIDSDGNKLLGYKPITIFYKKQKGEVYNRTTLLDTEDFYKGFDLLLRNNTISIFSRDSKQSDLVDKYGNIFGLIKDNQTILNYDILLPELQAYFKTIL